MLICAYQGVALPKHFKPHRDCSAGLFHWRSEMPLETIEQFIARSNAFHIEALQIEALFVDVVEDELEMVDPAEVHEFDYLSSDDRTE